MDLVETSFVHLKNADFTKNPTINGVSMFGSLTTSDFTTNAVDSNQISNLYSHDNDGIGISFAGVKSLAYPSTFSSNLTVSNISTSRNGAYGMSIEWNAQPYTIRLRNVTISNWVSYLDNDGHGGAPQGQTAGRFEGAENFLLSNSSVQATPYDCIDFVFGSGYALSNVSCNNFNFGSVITAVSGISGNSPGAYVDSLQLSNVRVAGDNKASPSNGISIAGATRVTLEAVTVSGAKWGAGGQGHGISLYNASHVLAGGVSVVGADDNGMFIQGAQTVAISHSEFWDNGQSASASGRTGLYVTGSPRGSLIGIISYDDQTVPTQQYGVIPGALSCLGIGGTGNALMQLNGACASPGIFGFTNQGFIYGTPTGSITQSSGNVFYDSVAKTVNSTFTSGQNTGFLSTNAGTAASDTASYNLAGAIGSHGNMFMTNSASGFGQILGWYTNATAGYKWLNSSGAQVLGLTQTGNASVLGSLSLGAGITAAGGISTTFTSGNNVGVGVTNSGAGASDIAAYTLNGPASSTFNSFLTNSANALGQTAGWYHNTSAGYSWLNNSGTKVMSLSNVGTVTATNGAFTGSLTVAGNPVAAPVAGAGISISGSTISNAGTLAVSAGTGISVSVTGGTSTVTNSLPFTGCTYVTSPALCTNAACSTTTTITYVSSCP